MTHFYSMAGKKLLVADDSLTIQKVIRLALSNEGYEIQAVSDGNDAVQQISLFHPDVVLIDVSLPGQTAFEVKRTVNAQSDLSDVRFILMSSAFEKVDETQFEEVGFQGRLTKPFDPAHLRQVIAEVLGKTSSATSGPGSTMAAPPANAPKGAHSFPPVPPAFPEAENLPPPTETEWPVTMEPDQEAVKDLWDSELELDQATPPPTGIPTPHHEGTGEHDIKHLTESTIRISGLDDFQWSVQEPSLKPPASFSDDGGNQFQVTPPSFEQNSAMQLDTPSSQTPPPPPSSESIEAMVQKQVEEQLSKLAKKMLPEIAERLIKQEIHRMLSEQS